jgi:hypothetical protein
MPMNTRCKSAVLLGVVLSFTLLGRAGAEAAKTEIKGAAILEHPCGKVAVKHMGLVHAGKMDEATRLGTPQMQAQWKALPAEQREMMSGMMKETSKTEAQFAAEIKAGGVLALDGNSGTLTVQREHKDANGTVNDTLTQNYVLDGASCAITR